MSYPDPPSNVYSNTIQDGVFQSDGQTDLQREHPELYGRLLMAEEKISNVGGFLIWLSLLFVIALCTTIHMAWVDPLFGVPIAKLQSWWVYLLITVAVFILYCLYNEFFQKVAYRKLRDGILNELSQKSLSVPWLISQIDSDSKLPLIVTQLKNENE